MVPIETEGARWERRGGTLGGRFGGPLPGWWGVSAGREWDGFDL